MLTRIKVENFRGITSADVPLFPVTVLVAPNNAGKSTLLEALAISIGGVQALPEIVRRRGWPGLSMLSAMLPHEKTKTVVQRHDGTEVTTTLKRVSIIESTDTEHLQQTELKRPQAVYVAGHPRSGRFFIDAQGRTFTVMHSGGDLPGFARLLTDQQISPDELVDAVGIIARRGESTHARLVQHLKVIDPDLADIRAIPVDNARWEPHAMYADRTIPLAVFGDGMKRLLSLVARLSGADEFPALIEEPECFQHPRVLNKIADIIWSAADANAQVIVSTHSVSFFELLRQRAQEETDRRDKFGLIEIERGADGNVTTAAFPQGIGPFRSELLREKLGG
ncbi:AAA family ATPase [Polyangium spumosum]|uniref:AAA family ATPase n=1 Tax=Polyangium spumosum TaxID=889282 RepID=A0A6N7PJJ2_9BACT|nr:ATP-binding protein [Polyangium spumosum]MRG90325.1 AAA family ATPase [Polyangium spumosum]